MNRDERAALMRENRRRSIVDAAIDLAETEGFASLRQAAVAKRAGVAHGSVTHEFTTMDALKDVVMQEAVARYLPTIIAAGLAVGHPVARDAPPELRQAAALAIA
jgi:AcrR family transcriptional regulator